MTSKNHAVLVNGKVIQRFSNNALCRTYNVPHFCQFLKRNIHGMQRYNPPKYQSHGKHMSYGGQTEPTLILHHIKNIHHQRKNLFEKTIIGASFNTGGQGYSTARYFSSSSGPGEGKGGDEAPAGAASSGGEGDDPPDSEDGDAGYTPEQEPYPPTSVALATMQPPEYFPKVPVIAVKRNPVFPRFIKMIEVYQYNTV